MDGGSVAWGDPALAWSSLQFAGREVQMFNAILFWNDVALRRTGSAIQRGEGADRPDAQLARPGDHPSGDARRLLLDQPLGHLRNLICKGLCPSSRRARTRLRGVGSADADPDRLFPPRPRSSPPTRRGVRAGEPSGGRRGDPRSGLRVRGGRGLLRRCCRTGRAIRARAIRATRHRRFGIATAPIPITPTKGSTPRSTARRRNASPSPCATRARQLRPAPLDTTWVPRRWARPSTSPRCGRCGGEGSRRSCHGHAAECDHQAQG